MAKLAEELWNTLQDLREEEFQNFKWFLKQDDVLEGSSGIAAAQLERAERRDTVDLMVQKYQGPGALQAALKVLEKISRNDLVQRLESSGPKDLKNHEAVPLKSHYERQKAELGAKIKLMIRERRMKIREVERSSKLSSRSADRHIANSERVFTVLLQSVERILAKLIKDINEKRKTTQKKADEFIRELEQEICELEKRSEELTHTDDHLDFLKRFSSETATLTTKSWTEDAARSYGGSLRAAVNQLEEKLSTEKTTLIAKAKLIRIQEFAKDVTLDPNTANPFLVLSDDGKQVHCGDIKQKLPDSPERFNTASNVLGKQSFSSGRFYYEVQVTGKTSWDLGVVKESVDRKGRIEPSPENGFWTICLRTGNKYRASAGSLSVKLQPQTVGVFVDYEKGSVSFYDADSADLIHCLSDCSFTEKLRPFFSPGCHRDATNSAPLVISPVSYSGQISKATHNNNTTAN